MFASISLIALLIALIGNLLYFKALRHTATTAPRSPVAEPPRPEPTATVSVIIPAYNEAENIELCVRSVLDHCNWPPDRLEVWVVDDQSTDDTLKRVQALQTHLADPRLVIIKGQPRPTNETWLGKNWACHQGAIQATGDFLLFLDADVQLHPGAIAAAIAFAQKHHSDLTTGVLTLVCQCWAEWLAQPLIIGLLSVGLPFAAVNDSNSDAAFAAGQFMLFRQSAYELIGGHRAVADQVVEDVELARRIKQKGLKLSYTIAHGWGTLRMYRTTAALWEGWTKNWYLGAQRNLPNTLYTVLMTLWLCTVPWLGLTGFASQGIISGFDWQAGIGIAIAVLSICLHYLLRREIQSISAIPPRYWWAIGIGGMFVTSIILASIVKTETGWGWTWRGRPLHQPQSTKPTIQPSAQD
jgi:hypothetical protein